MKQEFKKTAIITGSGRGIGKETAIILAKKSVNVVVCSRTQSEINSAVKEINRQTGNSNALGIKCDVSIPSQVNSLVKSAMEKFGSRTIDILVNNEDDPTCLKPVCPVFSQWATYGVAASNESHLQWAKDQ